MHDILPTYKLKPNEPFSNIHSHQYWKVMEGCGENPKPHHI